MTGLHLILQIQEKKSNRLFIYDLAKASQLDDLSYIDYNDPKGFARIVVLKQCLNLNIHENHIIFSELVGSTSIVSIFDIMTGITRSYQSKVEVDKKNLWLVRNDGADLLMLSAQGKESILNAKEFLALQNATLGQPIHIDQY
jgi:hypothetical protein